MNNNFLHKVAIIIIFNIDSEIIYSELLLSLKQDPRFKYIERTHSTDSDGKLIIITTKASKEAAIVIIDSLIEKRSAPNSNPNKRPGRSTKYNINSTLVSYAAMLQSNIEPTNNTKKIPLLVFRSETSKFHMILLRIQNFLPPIRRNRNLLLLIKTMNPLMIKPVNYQH